MEVLLTIGLIFVVLFVWGCMSASKGPLGDIVNIIEWIIRKGVVIFAILAIIAIIFGGV